MAIDDLRKRWTGAITYHRGKPYIILGNAKTEAMLKPLNGNGEIIMMPWPAVNSMMNRQTLSKERAV